MVPCAATNLDMFDKLRNAQEPILRKDSWAVVKCFDDEVDGFPIQDMLRELLLRGSDSVNAGLLDNAEPREFLWRLFGHLALGGSVNQFEDDVDEYRQACKALYKSLMSYASLGLCMCCRCATSILFSSDVHVGAQR